MKKMVDRSASIDALDEPMTIQQFIDYLVSEADKRGLDMSTTTIVQEPFIDEYDQERFKDFEIAWQELETDDELARRLERERQQASDQKARELREEEAARDLYESLRKRFEPAPPATEWNLREVLG